MTVNLDSSALFKCGKTGYKQPMSKFSDPIRGRDTLAR